MKNDRVLTAIFCDDIRKEEGNKLSYMGVYTGFLGVTNFPAILPRLCVALTLRLSPDMVPSNELRFRLCIDDAVSAEYAVPAETLADSRLTASKIGDERFTQFGTIFQMFPVQLSGPCSLRVRAICDGEEVKGGSLTIVEQKDMERAIRVAAGLQEDPSRKEIPSSGNQASSPQ
jgi:hypothetical protein